MLKLIGDNGRIEVAVLDYLHEDAGHSEDRNWLTCRISACLGGFCFTANCAIQTYDIQHLHELFQSQRQAFSWLLPDDDVTIEFCVEDRVLKSALLVVRQKTAAEEMSSSFAISTQIQCREVLEEIEELMVEFPVLR